MSQQGGFVMKKYFLYAIILFVIVVSIYSYYDTHKYEKIKKAIALQLKQTNGQKIDFSKIKNVVFDRVCFFGSYFPKEYVTGVLGVNWDINKKTSIGDNDGVSAIVFVKKNTVTAFCEYPLALKDFEIPLSQCITRKKPVLNRKKRYNYYRIWEYKKTIPKSINTTRDYNLNNNNMTTR